MIRRLFLTLMLAGCAAMLMITPALAEKSYYAERFDVQIEVQGDGSALITETVDFHFSGEPFTFAFREISATETDGISVLETRMDGILMPQGSQAGQAEVISGDPVKVTWHFSPTSESTHTFTVRYRAAGVIRKGAADTLIWRAVPEEHEYSIMQSKVTLIWPSGVIPIETPSLNRAFQSGAEDGLFILTTSRLSADEDLIVTARFPRDSITLNSPTWQARQEQRRAAINQTLPLGFLAAIASIVLGSLGLFFLVRSASRDLNINAVVSSAIPPGGNPPALIGKLTGKHENLMGMIFDLARLGVLEIREDKGFLGSRQHTLILKDPAGAQKPYEQALLEKLFPSGKNEVKFSNLSPRLEEARKTVNERLDEELLRNGWIDPERKQYQTRLQRAAFLVLFLVPLVLIMSLIGYNSSLAGDARQLSLLAVIVGLAAGALIPAFGLMIYAIGYSILTPAGEEQAARWRGFAEYLGQVSKGQEPATRADYFERYLAYAVVFGLGTRWARYFQSFGGVPLPTWFHAAAGSDGDFGAMVAVMSSSDSAGAGADGGGGGASGGGSSGAG